MQVKPLSRAIFLLILIISIVTMAYSLLVHPRPAGQQITSLPPVTQRIILVPLDSRPPCSQLVVDNGRTAGIEIVLPPHELLDYYTQPGNTQALQAWLSKELPQADGAIISIEQLLYGGLLASREKPASEAQLEALTAYLQQLHAVNPDKPLYAFDILPRMNPPASIETYRGRQNLMEWSRLTGRIALQAYPAGEDAASLAARLTELESEIPQADLALYNSVYSSNRCLNQQLALMVKDGTLTRLVLGQDDGEKYSLPNVELAQLEEFFHQQQLTPQQVVITHGADEVALSILAQLYLQQTGYQPKVYLDFNTAAMSEHIMPYMAISLRQSALEKILLSGACSAHTPEEADLILYISCGTSDTLAAREQAVQQLQAYLQQGKQVALVDLSQHFSAQETLFPLLLKQGLPINQLCAYAGWNTASNSIGTALAQAQIYQAALQQTAQPAANQPEAAHIQQPQSIDAINAVCCSNLINLSNRFGEDYYYLKDVIDLVNGQLKQKGYTNVYDLDLEHNYRWAIAMLRSAMSSRLNSLSRSHAYEQPFTLQTPAGPLTYQIRQLASEEYFPWPRTFEILLQCQLALFQINS